MPSLRAHTPTPIRTKRIKFASHHIFIVAICLVALTALTGTMISVTSGSMRSVIEPARTESSVFSSATESSQTTSATPVRASGHGGPWINFQDGREMRSQYRTTSGLASAEIERQLTQDKAQALSLASDDINMDGFPDLVCGYAGMNGGMVILHLGNPEAFGPKKEETIQGIIKGRYPDPFLSDATVLLTPETPDFLAVGDFDRDGHLDIITAARGASSIQLLAGDEGHGFRSARALPLPGQITGLITGEIDLVDGLTDVAVGIVGKQGPAVLVFDGANGGLTGKPISYPLQAAPQAMALGRLDDDPSIDLAVVAGGEIVIIHGQERLRPAQYEEGYEEIFGRMEPIRLPFAVKTIAVSDFIWDRDARMEMAVLSEDGAVRILRRGELDTRPLTKSEALEGRRLAAEAREGGKLGPDRTIRKRTKPLKWEVAEKTTISVSTTDGFTQPLLMGTLASGQRSYDLLVLNPAARRLHISMNKDSQPGRAESSSPAGLEAFTFDTDDEPVAALPMRLNVHGRPGIVVMRRGHVSPAYLMTAAAATFMVTKTTDTNDGVCNADCSLREAVVAANAAAGADMITFAASLNGSPIQLTITGDDNASATGDLDINTDITIVGNGAANTLIQGSNNASFTSNMGDKIFGVNQDGLNPTLNASLSGLTVRFTRNDIAVNPSFTQTGGAMDIFLTGTGANPGPTTTVTSCVFDSNASLHSYGGAINVDSGSLSPPTTNVFRGTVQFTNTTISNNDTLTTSGADDPPTGGGVNLFADIDNVTFTNCSITGNQTSAINTANGGGVNMRHSNGGTVTMSNTTVSNNIAGSDGGGVMLTFNQNLTMTGGSITGNTAQGTGGDADGGGLFNGTNTLPSGDLTLSLSNVTISNNVATAGANGRGGGLHNNANSPITLTNCVISGNSADTGAGVANVADTVTINGTTPTGSSITGNTAGASGGGVATLAASAVTNITNTTLSGDSAATSGGAFFVSGGTLTASLNRIVNNTSPTGSGIAQTGGVANVENNWWGCDGFPNATGCQTGAGTFDADPRVDLKVTAAPTSVSIGGTSTITASFTTNSNNAAINPIVMNGLPVTFSALNGTMSPAAGTIASLTSTSTFTNTVCANGVASATVDNGTDSATITFNKANTTTTITGDAPDPSVSGQPYTVTFTVVSASGAPTGNVTVTDGTNSCIGAVAAGQCTLTSLTAGAKTLVATYAGDACFNGSVSAGAAHTVNKANTVTTITSDNPDPSVTGQSVTVTFTVVAQAPGGGTPTGNVTVTVSGGAETCTGSVAAGQCTLTLNSAGARTLTATYAGDANYNGSSDTEGHTVNKANTVTTITSDNPDPSNISQSVTVTFTVVAQPPGSGVPTGAVTVTASGGSETCTGTVATGQCALTLNSGGPRTLTATYAGDANFNSSSDTEAHTVNAANTTTTVASSQNPSVFGQPVTFTATVSASPSPAVPTGTVVFTIDGNPTAPITLNAAGQAAFTTSTLSVGPHNVVATYTSNNPNFNGSVGTLTQVVNAANTTTTVVSSQNPSVFGQPVTFTATVSASPSPTVPTGSVVFTIDGNPTAPITLNAAGQATFTTSTLTVGPHTVVAAYTSNSANFNNSVSATITQTVNKANTTTTILTDNPDPSNVGQNVIVTYSVVAAPPGAGTPTGNVTVSDGVNSCVGTVAAGQCTVALTTAGSRILTATYAGDGNFNGSSDTEPHEVGTPVGPGAPFPATSELSDQKSGSILIYNIYTSSAASPNSQNSRVNITNIDPTRPVFVKLFFVDGASCSVADSFVCLTANQTASFLASDIDPGATGYIVAVAVDSRGCPINFNSLIGDAYVRFPTGHTANLGAEAIAAVSGGPSTCDGNSVTAQLNFDGVSYNRIPRVVALDNILARADGNDTLLILNRIGGNLGIGAATLSGMFGIFYNDGETGVSFTFSPNTCQFRSIISNNFPRITPRFEQFIPAGRSGWLKLFSSSDQGILGAAINFNPNAPAAAGAFNQGHNLHKLTLTPNASYIIPVIQRNC